MTTTHWACGPGGLPPSGRRVRAGEGGNRGKQRRQSRQRKAQRHSGRNRGLDGRLLRRALKRRGRRRAAGQRRDHDAGRRQGHRHEQGAKQERREGGRHEKRDQEDGRDSRRRRLKSAVREQEDIAATHARRQAQRQESARQVGIRLGHRVHRGHDRVAFDEADSRDTQRTRQRVYLADGNRQQITAIEEKAAGRCLKVTVLIDTKTTAAI